MSAYKKNGSYYIKGRIDRIDGSVRYYHRKADNAKNIQEARKYEIEFLRKYQDIEISKNVVSFRDLCDEFIDQDYNIKETSRRSKADLLYKACDKFGKIKINLITVDSLRKYVRNFEETYSCQYSKKMYYALKNVFDYAVYQGYIQVSPMNRVKRKVDKNKISEEIVFWEPYHFETFIKEIDNLEERAFFITLYYMGMRRGELSALYWKDINFIDNTINIYKTVTDKVKGKTWLITSPKSKNSIRKISMPDEVIKIMKEWKSENEKIVNFSEDCFVFGFYRPIHLERMRRRLQEKIKKLNEEGNNIPVITLHSFRHSHASYLINNMSNQFTDFDIAKRLGDTVATLHSTYAHWFKQADKSIVDFINNNPAGKKDKFEELKNLKELLDMNILTQEEFDEQKKKILNT